MNTNLSKEEFENAYTTSIIKFKESITTCNYILNNEYAVQIDKLLSVYQNAPFITDCFRNFFEEKDPELLFIILTDATKYKILPLETKKKLKKMIKEYKEKDPFLSLRAKYCLKKLMYGKIL